MENFQPLWMALTTSNRSIMADLLSSYDSNIVITIISIINLLLYLFFILYIVVLNRKLNSTSQLLQAEHLHLNALNSLHNNIRGFKHDFNNIVQGLGGYIEDNDMEGLKRYYNQLLTDCKIVNNLSTLSSTIINNPAIYNIISNKYYRANEKGIVTNITVLMDLNELENHLKIYEFTRILGILLDNAIEAAMECDKKVINVTFRNQSSRHRYLVVIENTYLDKNIDIEKIFQKSFSTKSEKTNSGLGLWEIRQVLKKYNNLNLFTSKNDEYFKQQLEIYY